MTFAAALLQVVFQPPTPGGFPGIPFEAVLIAKSFFTMIIVIALGIPIIRSLSRRFIERPPVTTLGVPPDVISRLERIEQAVEAVAIEVERIAEAQRFAAKLMAEERALPAGAARSTPRAAAEPVARTDQSR